MADKAKNLKELRTRLYGHQKACNRFIPLSDKEARELIYLFEEQRLLKQETVGGMCSILGIDRFMFYGWKKKPRKSSYVYQALKSLANEPYSEC